MTQPTTAAKKILAWAEQDGVDLTMLRERLRLTPTERLQRHQAALELVEALRNARRTANRAPSPALRRERSKGKK
jgi:hypothetical protein